MASDDPFSKFEALRHEFENAAKHARMLLVDLVGSTAYKGDHLEINWITRLKKFYDTVVSTMPSSASCKFLGDAVLVTFFDEGVTPNDIMKSADYLLGSIRALNRELPGAHSIKVRIILSSGKVFPFHNVDPQGSAVDKLFRMEKHVPTGCIGMTEEFAREGNYTEDVVARYHLRGLPNPPSHGLLLFGDAATPTVKKKLRDESRVAALWSQPIADESTRTLLVGGHIPGTTISSVQMGDVNAKLCALRTLTSLDDPPKIEICDSASFPSTGYSQNIVAIGGPCFNTITEHLMAGLPLRFENCDGDDDITPIFVEQTGCRFNSESDNGRLIKDWGVLVRMRNPNEPNRRVIIAAGIESPAVEGIVEAFTCGNPHISSLLEGVIALGPGSDGDENS